MQSNLFSGQQRHPTISTNYKIKSEQTIQSPCKIPYETLHTHIKKSLKKLQQFPRSSLCYDYVTYCQ